MNISRTRGVLTAGFLATLEGSAWFGALSMATATRLSIAGGEVAWRPVFEIAAVTAAVHVAAAAMVAWERRADARETLRASAPTAVAWAAGAAVVAGSAVLTSPRAVPLLAAAGSLPLALLMMLGGRSILRSMFASTPTAAGNTDTALEMADDLVADLRLPGDTAAPPIDLLAIKDLVRDKHVVITGEPTPFVRHLGRLVREAGCAELTTLERYDDVQLRNRLKDSLPHVVLQAGELERPTVVPATDDEPELVDLDGFSNFLLGVVSVGVEAFANIAPGRSIEDGSLDDRARSEAERLTAVMDDAADGRFVSIRFGNDDEQPLPDFGAARLALHAAAIAPAGQHLVISPSGGVTPGPRIERRRGSGIGGGTRRAGDTRQAGNTTSGPVIRAPKALAISLGREH
ncbi:MAG: hypothetical protein ACRBI6_20410 [Acidimicrobiales bacterium]